MLKERWKAKHTFIDGQRLVFTGSAVGLFGHWIKWFPLSVITIGIYLFWVGPRLQKWVTVNTEFANQVAPLQTCQPPPMARLRSGQSLFRSADTRTSRSSGMPNLINEI